MKNLSFMLFLLLSFGFVSPSALGQLTYYRDVPYTWKTDTSRALIPLSEVVVVLPRNAFPTIDFPNFIEKEAALKSFFRHEPVLAVAYGGEAKAYPLNMLTMHEISNDSLGGIPILPTYCPLCNASIVYDRRIKSQGKEHLLEFEVSGMLRHSDMVMADKQTETWWQQLSGEGIVGELAGVTLSIIPSLVISLEEFLNRYPEGKVLSPSTGTSAVGQYGKNPYLSYDDPSGKPYERYFDHQSIDQRLPAMERIVEVKSSAGYTIYPFSILSKKGVINDRLDGTPIVIFYGGDAVSVLDKQEISKSRKIGSATIFKANPGGQTLHFEKKKTRFRDLETGSIWDITGQCVEGELKGTVLVPQKHGHHFAFAWLNFFPESKIFGSEK